MRERAYNHIQQKLISSELPPGSVVSELALAQELGISRTPVREAIGQLVSEGLLEQSPNHVAVVAQLTHEEIVKLYELREALEVYALGKVAAQPNKGTELERIQKLNDRILSLRDELNSSGEKTLLAEQMYRFLVIDLGVHTLLLRLAGNDRILKLVNETRLLIRIFVANRHGYEQQEIERIHRSHREIIEALINNDVEKARRLMSEHIQNSCRERMQDYDRLEWETMLRQSLPDWTRAAPEGNASGN